VRQASETVSRPSWLIFCSSREIEVLWTPQRSASAFLLSGSKMAFVPWRRISWLISPTRFSRIERRSVWRILSLSREALSDIRRKNAIRKDSFSCSSLTKSARSRAIRMVSLAASRVIG